MVMGGESAYISTMKVGIIGGGIVGLTTGVVLAEAGHKVEILTREPIEQTTSYAAAAISYPVNVEDSARVNQWFVRSNEVLAPLVKDKHSGVSWINWKKFSKKPMCPLPSWMAHVERARAMERSECPAPYLSGIEARLVLMNVDVYCAYMMTRFHKSGGVYTIREVESVAEIEGDYDALINCTGVYAHDFTPDKEVSPARGQVVIVKNPGVQDHVSTFDSKNYLYPRGDRCVLGGSFDVGEWDTEPDDDLTQEILNWAADFDERFIEAEVLDVRVGLRPLRDTVRLNRDVKPSGTPLIHNYGHGGAGYTLSWGCAFEVLKGVESL